MQPLSYKFEISQNQYLVVDKTSIIQALFDNFHIKMSGNDIKILKDGLQLQLTLTGNKIPSLTFKKLSDMFATDGVDKVVYDDQSLKLWIDASHEYLFVESGDDKLQVVQAGVDAPAGTVQVTVEEGHIYTLLYAEDDKISEAINESLKLVGNKISMRINSEKDAHIDDHRVSIIRKKYGKSNKMYNDRVGFVNQIIKKVVVHV